MFLKEVSYAYQDCIYLIKNTIKQHYLETLLQFKITAFFFNLFKIVICSCDSKAEFSVFTVTSVQSA